MVDFVAPLFHAAVVHYVRSFTILSHLRRGENRNRSGCPAFAARALPEMLGPSSRATRSDPGAMGQRPTPPGLLRRCAPRNDGGHAKSGSALAIPRQTPHAPTPRGRRGRSRRASPGRRVACGKIGFARAQSSVRRNRPPTAIVPAQRRRRQRRTRRRVLDRRSRLAPAAVARWAGLDPFRS